MVQVNATAGVLDDDTDVLYPDTFVTVLSIVLIIELLVGVTLNVLVLVVYHLPHKSVNTVSDLFITNMNFVDVLICTISITMSVTLLLTTYNVPLFCYFHEATVSFASTASAVNVLIISLDRRDRILRPLNRRFTNRNAIWIILFTWLIAIGGFCSPFFGINVADFRHASEISGHTRRKCYYWFNTSRRNYYYELYHVPIFLLASLVMIFAYYSIIKVARKGRTIQNAFLQATLTMQSAVTAKVGKVNNHRDPEKRVSMTTTIIITTFIICWGPHTFTSIVILCTEPSPFFEILQLCLLSLGYTTTLMHPILYVFMRRNFRAAIKTACCGKHCHRSRVVPHAVPNRNPTSSRPEFPELVENDSLKPGGRTEETIPVHKEVRGE
ncbi:G-protein coupled receptor 22-like [Saccoglossus kowalevskii]|uniref:Probable G-protein coupled receptor 22-like n=1 Tax=Saccoglossus kowalevskii TaxID=10224 RepID=A0ABM0N0W0_SACKO|nr:PREDICTED: probable G-protein coupled receptor 22-like [Saccoglossus kowalevskii]